MATHRAVHVASAGAPLELVDGETRPPGRDEVRLTVTACGICGTDAHFVAGNFPGLSWPLTPGHEIAGKIAEVGDGVEDFAVGDRVAVGWFGGNASHCAQCRKGQFIHCLNGKVPSWHYPGGYAESVTAPATALARIPDELTDAEAAPMGCAGVTTYNALRHTNALPGDRVAILGVGGLGHLGVQFARAMSFDTIAIARGTKKAEDARKLGAHHFIDSTAGDVSEALRALGGATVVLGTAGARADGAAPQGHGRRARRAAAAGPADHHRCDAGTAADQSGAVDNTGPQHHRASFRHSQRCRGDNAFRGHGGRAGLDREGAAVAGRGGLSGGGWGAGGPTHRLVHV